MRREAREIKDRKEIDAILGAARLMRIALTDGNVPFLVPVFYAYDGQALYFHSAPQGSKVEIMKRNDLVCFEVSIDHGIIEDEMICDFEARHRTVIGLGRTRFVGDRAEKIRALDLIVARFTNRAFEYPVANLDRTLVVRIDIDSVKGKQHGTGGG
ncbi:pyridoxamine 5'-phosphate oxidase family protein [Pseudothauera nasutitermitis]|uniref:Pyridoxamine 5'-phosphate oxidase family protein n=2 Tax=Pseudothauera nasutitermitis TaxID=2565930 RepID=A0A4S4B1K6_9RHOO|nr:pyridoxamine 5'-phosphate oxidase family protein [Pseudothauera nasutitermitis]